MAKTTQAQVQIQKPATKSATKKATKSAQKPAAPAQEVKQAEKPAFLFGVRDGFRPQSGRLLFAYTMAWLQVSGLIDGGTVPRAQAIKAAGSTAIKYHTQNTGRMVDDGSTVKLAAGGANFFADRAHDAKDREAYAEMLTTGKPDGRLIKAKEAFVSLA